MRTPRRPARWRHRLAALQSRSWANVWGQGAALTACAAALPGHWAKGAPAPARLCHVGGHASFWQCPPAPSRQPPITSPPPRPTRPTRPAPQVVDEAAPPLSEYYRHISKGAWPFSSRDHGWPISDCSAEGLKAALTLALLPADRCGACAAVGLPCGNSGQQPPPGPCCCWRVCCPGATRHVAHGRAVCAGCWAQPPPGAGHWAPSSPLLLLPLLLLSRRPTLLLLPQGGRAHRRRAAV
jgi:hypothetical protein